MRRRVPVLCVRVCVRVCAGDHMRWDFWLLKAGRDGAEAAGEDVNTAADWVVCENWGQCQCVSWVTAATHETAASDKECERERRSERERCWILSFRDLIKMSARAWHKNWVMGVKSEPKFRCLTNWSCGSFSVAEQEKVGEKCMRMGSCPTGRPADSARSLAGATPAAPRHKAVIKFLDVPSAKLNTQMSGADTEICCWLIEK